MAAGLPAAAVVDVAIRWCSGRIAGITLTADFRAPQTTSAPKGACCTTLIDAGAQPEIASFSWW
jgi:hypothetical protein